MKIRRGQNKFVYYSGDLTVTITRTLFGQKVVIDKKKAKL